MKTTRKLLNALVTGLLLALFSVGSVLANGSSVRSDQSDYFLYAVVFLFVAVLLGLLVYAVWKRRR